MSAKATLSGRVCANPTGALRIALGCLCALSAACGDESGDESPPVWTETSRSIEVFCVADSQGSMRFAATRDQLSASQLDMLSRLSVVDPFPVCLADGMFCSLTVAQADSSTTTIRAMEGNYACDYLAPVVSYQTFDPFRRSLGCQYAKDLTLGQTTAPAPVAADPRCYNGLFSSGGDSLITVTLGVGDTTAPYRIELDDCAQPRRVGTASFTVIDGDGATILGSSTAPSDPGPDWTCAALDMAFPHSGSFALEVALASLSAGDFSLRFY